jgi:hypothetical protein
MPAWVPAMWVVLKELALVATTQKMQIATSVILVPLEVLHEGIVSGLQL